MKKIYKTVFAFAFLFYVTSQLAIAQTENNNTRLYPSQTKLVGSHIITHVTTKPLFIIDGVQYSQEDLAAINPDNIKSVTVLKGESATNLYGSDGANGVIVITLKNKKNIMVEEVEKTEKQIEKVEEEIAIEEKEIEKISINIFPNPTSESVNVTLHLKEKSVVEIVMYNLQTLESYEVSKEVYEAGEQKINWKVDSLQNGTYNIKIKIGNQIIDRKLVIQN